MGMFDDVEETFTSSNVSKTQSIVPSKLGENRRITPNGPEAENLVKQEVERHFRYKKHQGKGILVQCPFHVSDTGFSMTLNINTVAHNDNRDRHIPVGFYHCWSCGTAGPWNRLAAHLKLQQIEETDNYELGGNVYHIQFEKDYERPHDSVLSDIGDFYWKRKSGNHISNKTLVKLGAMFHHTPVLEEGDFFLEKRLWLPCYEDGDLVGHIGAALSKKVKPKYLNAEGAWAMNHFFGWDSARKIMKKIKSVHGCKKFVFVVEGSADALWLQQHGIPAVASLGTETFSDAKKMLLLAQYDCILGLGDGDDAGRKFNKHMKKKLKNDVIYKGFSLDEGVDPADLKKDNLEWLKSKALDLAQA